MNNKREQIETAARQLAQERGAINVTRKEVCELAGIPDGAFSTVMGETFLDLIQRLKLPVGGTVDRRRAYAPLRLKAVLGAAIEAAKTGDYATLLQGDVAELAGISRGLVNHYFGNIETLREVVLAAAIKRNIPEIVAQGLARKDPLALAAPKEVKALAVSYLTRL